MIHDAAAALHAYAAAHAVAMPTAMLDRCTEEQAPILKMIYKPCPPGFHDFGCETRWGMHDSFLPRPRKWVRQFNASVRAEVDCQRAFFDAFAAVLTRAHWEQEWDAQPYRIAAVPPRTMGKMIHQLVTANYYHLTLGPQQRPPLRQAPAPGSHFRKLPQPGFRWNVLDFGGGTREEIDYKRLTTMAGNVFSRPLSTGTRCAGVRGAWHCLWQRFPTQHLAPSPSPGTVLGRAAEALYNLSWAGRRPDGLVQYLVAAGVMHVFTQPTPQVQRYLADFLRAICHRGGPYCGGTADEQRTPVVAVHVRRGDSCDRPTSKPGPWNAMWQPDPKRPGKLTRDGVGRRCYSWQVYMEQLRTLQAAYGVRTVLLATDDHTGELVRGLAAEKAFNWLCSHAGARTSTAVHVSRAPALSCLAHRPTPPSERSHGPLAWHSHGPLAWTDLDYPRKQFRKRAWMEFRSDLDENAPFSLAAELELLSKGHVFVGHMGSHTSRTIYTRLVAASRTGVLPPFISVDGYGLCCGFTDECTHAQVRARRRKARECIYSYGTVTGGEQWFFHRG